MLFVTGVTPPAGIVWDILFTVSVGKAADVPATVVATMVGGRA